MKRCASTESSSSSSSKRQRAEEIDVVLPEEILQIIFSEFFPNFGRLTEVSKDFERIVKKMSINLIGKYFPYIKGNFLDNQLPMQLLFKEYKLYERETANLSQVTMEDVLSALEGKVNKQIPVLYYYAYNNGHKVPNEVMADPMSVLCATISRNTHQDRFKQ